MNAETMSRQERFEKAKAEEAARKAEEANNAGGKGYEKRDYDEVCYLGLDYDTPKLVRLLGNPKIARDNDPYSPKAVNISWITGDNDKPFRCVWPLKEENPSWIMWKIFDKVMAYKWEETLNGGKGGRVYLNAESHPSIFKRVDKNNKDNTMERGWNPAKHIVWNCIDRLDMQYHKDNKKTKLLSKKADYNKEGKQMFPQPGIPEAAYDKIWDDIVEFYGDWEGYDIQITKQKGQKVTDVTYQAICAKETMKIKKELQAFIVDGSLTEFDMSLERLDIDKMFQVTSYQKLLKNLGIFIQSVDAAFKTKFFEELTALATAEKKLWEIKNAENAKNAEANGSTEKESAQAPAPAPKATPVSEMSTPEPVPAPAPRARTANTNTDTNTKPLNFDDYKGYAKLSEDEKAMIVGINSDGSFRYNCKTDDLLPCSDDNCKFESPNTFGSCPKCGIEYTA